jgi:hypothetical protein
MSDQADDKSTEGEVTNATRQQPASDSFYCTKYLSNSRLLHLQLADAGLRRNVLCQLLMVLGQLGDNSAVIALKLPAELKPKTVTDISRDFSKRCLALLRGTPADGDAFTGLVKQVLHRERNWSLWKEQKCLPFERERLSGDVDDEGPEARADRVKRKRKADKVKRTIQVMNDA